MTAAPPDARTPEARPALRVGIVGCGNIARQHARAYAAHPGVRLVGYVDLLPERSAGYAAEFGGVAEPDVAGLLAQRPDLVSVATPPGSHAALAVELLTGGTSVLLEKPPTPTLAELDTVAAAEAASPGQAYVVFQHRHGSGARRAERLMTAGALGRPLVALCETLWFRPDSYFLPDWRGTWSGEGGGPTLGHGIHQLDLLLHLMGEWATVDARAGRLARPVEFEDVAVATVTFANGALASVVTSLLSPRELSRIRLDTTAGTLEVNHVYGYTDAGWSFSPAPDAATADALGKNPGAATDGTTGTTPDDVWTASADVDEPSNHGAQIRALVDDLLAGRPHPTTLASTRPTMELVTALYASALERRTVHRGELGPGSVWYDRLDGGLPADVVTARLTDLAQPVP